MSVFVLSHGEQLFTDLLGRVRADTALVEAMWADAESRPDELDLPGTFWSVALAADGAPAAWCAARVDDAGVLKCHSNYAVREYRGRWLYEDAYHARHWGVVRPFGLPAVTYLFEQPVRLHEASGWYQTGTAGAGELPDHRWFELRRDA